MSKIQHLIIPVENLDRSVDFYTNKLGLIPVEVIKKDTEKEVEVTQQFAILETQDKGYEVVLTEMNKPIEPRDSVIVAFIVQDLGKVIEGLRERGLEFEGKLQILFDKRVVHFKDPDGHIFQLVDRP